MKRKLLAMLLTVSMVLTMLPVASVNATTVMKSRCGDVNDDGAISITDCLQILMTLANISSSMPNTSAKARRAALVNSAAAERAKAHDVAYWDDAKIRSTKLAIGDALQVLMVLARINSNNIRPCITANGNLGGCNWCIKPEDGHDCKPCVPCDGTDCPNNSSDGCKTFCTPCDGDCQAECEFKCTCCKKCNQGVIGDCACCDICERPPSECDCCSYCQEHPKTCTPCADHGCSAQCVKCDGPCNALVCTLLGGVSHGARTGCNHSPARYTCDTQCTAHGAKDCEGTVCCTKTQTICTVCDNHTCDCPECICGEFVKDLPGGKPHDFCSGDCNKRICELVGDKEHDARLGCTHSPQRLTCEQVCVSHGALDCTNVICCTKTETICLTCFRHACNCETCVCSELVKDLPGGVAHPLCDGPCKVHVCQLQSGVTHTSRPDCNHSPKRFSCDTQTCGTHGALDCQNGACCTRTETVCTGCNKHDCDCPTCSPNGCNEFVEFLPGGKAHDYCNGGCGVRICQITGVNHHPFRSGCHHSPQRFSCDTQTCGTHGALDCQNTTCCTRTAPVCAGCNRHDCDCDICEPNGCNEIVTTLPNNKAHDYCSGSSSGCGMRICQTGGASHPLRAGCNHSPTRYSCDKTECTTHEALDCQNTCCTRTETVCTDCNRHSCNCPKDRCEPNGCDELLSVLGLTEPHPPCDGPCGVRICKLNGGISHGRRNNCNHDPRRYTCDTACSTHAAYDCQGSACCTIPTAKCTDCNYHNCECPKDRCEPNGCNELLSVLGLTSPHPYCDGGCGVRICQILGGNHHALRDGCNHPTQRYTCDTACSTHSALDCQSTVCCLLTTEVCTLCNKHACEGHGSCSPNGCNQVGVAHDYCEGNCGDRICLNGMAHHALRDDCNHSPQRYSCDTNVCGTHGALDCQSTVCCLLTTTVCTDCNRHACTGHETCSPNGCDLPLSDIGGVAHDYCNGLCEDRICLNGMAHHALRDGCNHSPQRYSCDTNICSSHGASDCQNTVCCLLTSPICNIVKTSSGAGQGQPCNKHVCDCCKVCNKDAGDCICCPVCKLPEPECNCLRCSPNGCGEKLWSLTPPNVAHAECEGDCGFRTCVRTCSEKTAAQCAHSPRVRTCVTCTAHGYSDCQIPGVCCTLTTGPCPTADGGCGLTHAIHDKCTNGCFERVCIDHDCDVDDPCPGCGAEEGWKSDLCECCHWVEDPLEHTPITGDQLCAKCNKCIEHGCTCDKNEFRPDYMEPLVPSKPPGQPNAVEIRTCSYLGCATPTANKEVCPNCGYCRDCEWLYFGVTYCSSCQWGGDCLASKDKDGKERGVDWCGECNICSGCCEHGSSASLIVPSVPVVSGVSCVYCDDPVVCDDCPIPMCVECNWIRFGIITCPSCIRDGDCISGPGYGPTPGVGKVCSYCG